MSGTTQPATACATASKDMPSVKPFHQETTDTAPEEGSERRGPPQEDDEPRGPPSDDEPRGPPQDAELLAQRLDNTFPARINRMAK